MSNGDFDWQTHRCSNRAAPPSPCTPPLPSSAGFDPINRPEHYASYKIQPIQFIRANDLPSWAANVVKYVTRESKKNGVEDLKKARKYLSMEIAFREGVEKWWEAE